LGEGSNADAEGEMLDGIMTCTSKPIYELPSQEELIQALVGDDVEDDQFEKDKQDEIILNEENHETEKPTLLYGWGHWADAQQKRGWMLKKHLDDQKKRDEENRQTRGPLFVNISDHFEIQSESESESESEEEG
jgi:U3 small nucleolar RNA-associated protein 14